MTDISVPPDPPKRSGALILEVACEQFHRQGIRAVGVDEVVTRAGFTKPSLYRAYGSKEGLIGAYLKVQEDALWRGLDEAAALHPLEPRAQIAAWLGRLAAEAARPGARGCPLSNAAVEFPEAGHPAREIAEAAKAGLRRRLRDLAARAGTPDPDAAGDGLLLLAEGAQLSGQMFGEDGPARALVRAAETLLGVPAATQPAAQPVAETALARPARPRPRRAPAIDDEQPTLF